MRIISVERCVQLPCALHYVLLKYTETPQGVVSQEMPTNALVERLLSKGSARRGDHGARPEVWPPELSPPGWGRHLADCMIVALLCLLLHFASAHRTRLEGS